MSRFSQVIDVRAALHKIKGHYSYQAWIILLSIIYVKSMEYLAAHKMYLIHLGGLVMDMKWFPGQ